MRIIFLNTWWGALAENLKKFIEDNYQETDIFCFQEANNLVLETSSSILKDFTLVRTEKHVDKNSIFSLATYIKNNHKINYSEVLFGDSSELGLGFHLQLEVKGNTLNLCNMHGAILPGDKSDTDARLAQSTGLINYFKNISGKTIIGGDFNLDIKTKSVSLFEEAGYRNLIKECGIKNTRNKYAWDIYPNSKQHFADFVFVNAEVEVKEFLVKDLEVSDHLPMFLDINI